MQSFEQINDRQICCHVFRREAVERRSKVRLWVELCVGTHSPGEITHSNWAPWDETDSELLTSLKYAIPFHISFHERVFSLDCRNQLHSVRPADGFCTRLRKTEVQNLSFPNEIFDCTGHIFNRHVWINPMLVIEINSVGLKTLQ
jgi:hypothetical protein